MKRFEAVIANTLLDSQGERLSREALDQLAESIEHSYIPVGIEHDPRIPPQGRMISSFVRERSDGEFEVVAVMELFEQDDEPEIIDDPKEIVMQSRGIKGFTISYDWTHRSVEDQQDILAIAEVFGNEPTYEIKKSAEPTSIITIAGAFVLGGIATGLLGQIGVDGWNLIKSKLARLFSRKENRKGEQLLRFDVLLEHNGTPLDVVIILTNPTLEDIDQFLAEGLLIIDKALPIYLRNSPHVRRFVFEVKGKDIELSFAVRKDCLSLKPTLTVKDILKWSKQSKN